MFKKLKQIFGVDDAVSQSSAAALDDGQAAFDFSDNHKLRFAEMAEYLGEPNQIFVDQSGEDHLVHIVAFERDFVEECDSDADSDEGFILVTSGMSDRAMPLHEDQDKDCSPRKELIWYVRELNDEFIRELLWLAKLPNFDQFFLKSGDRVPMPKAPISGCDFKTFLFLSPIIRTDRCLLDDIELGGEEIETLCVHLLSDAEYALIKEEDGLDQFLDMLDDNSYPLIFDPKRRSIV
jgi:hypothetical protein